MIFEHQRQISHPEPMVFPAVGLAFICSTALYLVDWNVMERADRF